MLDLRAAGPGRGEHRVRRVRVHQRPQSLRLRLAARRRELLVGHRLRAAVADALRREDLDEVGARLLLLADVLAHLIRRAGPLVHRAERRQDARARAARPRSIASRSSLSLAAPTLCTVVKPLISVTHAFSAAKSAISAGVSPWFCARPSLPK